MSYHHSRFHAPSPEDNGVSGIPVMSLKAEPVVDESVPLFYDLAERAPVYWSDMPAKELGSVAVMNSPLWYDLTGYDPNWMS